MKRMSEARLAFRRSYAAHRAAERLWRFMDPDLTMSGVPSFVSSVPGEFDSTRLHGDRLRLFFGRNEYTHRVRMYELRRRVRLPA